MVILPINCELNRIFLQILESIDHFSKAITFLGAFRTLMAIVAMIRRVTKSRTTYLLFTI